MNINVGFRFWSDDRFRLGPLVRNYNDHAAIGPMNDVIACNGCCTKTKRHRDHEKQFLDHVSTAALGRL